MIARGRRGRECAYAEEEIGEDRVANVEDEKEEHRSAHVDEGGGGRGSTDP